MRILRVLAYWWWIPVIAILMWWDHREMSKFVDNLPDDFWKQALKSKNHD